MAADLDEKKPEKPQGIDLNDPTGPSDPALRAVWAEGKLKQRREEQEKAKWDAQWAAREKGQEEQKDEKQPEKKPPPPSVDLKDETGPTEPAQLAAWAEGRLKQKQEERKDKEESAPQKKAEPQDEPKEIEWEPPGKNRPKNQAEVERRQRRIAEGEEKAEARRQRAEAKREPPPQAEEQQVMRGRGDLSSFGAPFSEAPEGGGYNQNNQKMQEILRRLENQDTLLKEIRDKIGAGKAG